MRNRFWKMTALVLLVATPLAILGCYGRFPVTHAVYEFNGDVGNDMGEAEKWVESGLLWVFVILPVYQLSMLGDAVIFNLIEFWTGETLDISAAPAGEAPASQSQVAEVQLAGQP